MVRHMSRLRLRTKDSTISISQKLEGCGRSINASVVANFGVRDQEFIFAISGNEAWISLFIWKTFYLFMEGILSNIYCRLLVGGLALCRA